MIIRRPFIASLEEHKIWRYVIKDTTTGTVVYDGWAGDLEEARQTAERQLAWMFEVPLPKAE